MMRTFALLTLAAVASVTAVSAATYTATMNSFQEVPPTGSPALGFTSIVITGDQMMVSVNWSGLIGGPAAQAHVHCCTDPGTNVTVAVGYSGFPAATSGSYTGTFNLLDSTIYTANFLTTFGGGTAAGARNALIAGLDAGRAYSNIHNATFPGGELRGNLTAVPEPSSLLLVTSALAAAVYARRRSRVDSGKQA